MFIFFFKQKTAYVMRISDWSSDVCSSDLQHPLAVDEDEHAVRTQIAKIDVRGAVRPVGDIFVGVGGELGKPVEHRFHRRRALIAELLVRSEERRVGTECVSTCRSWWLTSH